MPRKIRELKKDLRDAGFSMRRGKGDHTIWSHPRLAKPVTVSGNDGTDVKPYQEQVVADAIRDSRLP